MLIPVAISNKRSVGTVSTEWSLTLKPCSSRPRGTIKRSVVLYWPRSDQEDPGSSGDGEMREPDAAEGVGGVALWKPDSPSSSSTED